MKSVNYLMDAVENFLNDNGLSFNEWFMACDHGNKDKQIGWCFINVVNGICILTMEGVARDDILILLLSGKYVTKKKTFADEKNLVRTRGFELIKGKNGRLPERGTEFSAGYDFFAAEDWKILPHTTKTIWTGVKAFMPRDEVLYVFNRSSNARKKGLMLSNGVGVVDSDYYNNPDNEGDIGFDFYNYTDEIVIIKKGDKLGQAIFSKFFLADNDIHGGKRMGGFGSTGR